MVIILAIDVSVSMIINMSSWISRMGERLTFFGVTILCFLYISIEYVLV